MSVPPQSQNHTHLHTDTGTKHQRDPRRSHPTHIQTETHASAGKQAASKQPTSTAAVTDTMRPSRPTAAHLGAHGGGGGPIDHEGLVVIVVIVAYGAGSVITERLVRAAAKHQHTGMCSNSGLCCVRVSVSVACGVWCFCVVSVARVRKPPLCGG